MFKYCKWMAFLFVCASPFWGQTTIPARIIVTMGHYFRHEPPMLTANDLIVLQDNHPLKITSLTPLRGDRADLELFVLVDHCANCEASSQFEELKDFVNAQPSTTSVGVAYIKNGQLQVAISPTPDRDKTVRALSTPEGSAPASPYFALADLIKGWKKSASRRAVLMISTGLDPATGVSNPTESQSAEEALQAAQRAQVTVYAIYHPSADYLATDFSKLRAGQIQLAHVASDSGGEAYFLTFGPSLSVAPFLLDINQHLANQYMLEFLMPRGNPGEQLREVQVESKVVPEIDVMVPTRAMASQ